MEVYWCVPSVSDENSSVLVQLMSYLYIYQEDKNPLVSASIHLSHGLPSPCTFRYTTLLISSWPAFHHHKLYIIITFWKLHLCTFQMIYAHQIAFHIFFYSVFLVLTMLQKLSISPALIFDLFSQKIGFIFRHQSRDRYSIMQTSCTFYI